MAQIIGHDEEWDPIEFEGGSPLSIRFNHDDFWHHLRPHKNKPNTWILILQTVPGHTHKFDKVMVHPHYQSDHQNACTHGKGVHSEDDSIVIRTDNLGKINVSIGNGEDEVRIILRNEFSFVPRNPDIFADPTNKTNNNRNEYYDRHVSANDDVEMTNVVVDDKDHYNHKFLRLAD